jgi:DNA-binding MarR family transcriptional regulator
MQDDKPAERLRIAIGRMLRVFKVEGASDPDSPYAALNLSDLTALSLVGERPGSIMRDVAAELGSALSTATTVVDRLVNQGLVLRERVEENRRIVRLGLTDAGRDLYRRLNAMQTANCRAMLNALSPDEQAAYLYLAEKIAAAVDGSKSPVDA